MRTPARLSMLRRCATAFSLVAGLSAALSAGAQTAPAAPAAPAVGGAAGCPAILQHSFPRLQDEKP